MINLKNSELMKYIWQARIDDYVCAWCNKKPIEYPHSRPLYCSRCYAKIHLCSELRYYSNILLKQGIKLNAIKKRVCLELKDEPSILTLLNKREKMNYEALEENYQKIKRIVNNHKTYSKEFPNFTNNKRININLKFKRRFFKENE